MHPETNTHSHQEEDHAEAPEITTRSPRESDLEALFEIDKEHSGRGRRSFLKDRLARATRPSGISLARVAVRGDDVLGFLFGELTHGEFGRVGAVAWIDTLGVRRGELRRGVGSLLLEDLLRHATAAGAERVWTLIDPDDDSLTDFLGARGFQVAATRVIEKSLLGGIE